MGSASSAQFFAEPRSSIAQKIPEMMSHAIGAENWLTSILIHHFEGKPLTVDLVDDSGIRVSSVGWTFSQWFAASSSMNPCVASTRKLRPYVRNVHPPAELEATCLRFAPFPSALGITLTCSLFMGAARTRTCLHCDGVHNAVMVLRGLKLVVMIAAEHCLSSAELIGVNTVLCNLADDAMRKFPNNDVAGKSNGTVCMGNLALRYFWLEAGAVLTIPCGWYHFVHNQTFCISMTLWAKEPRCHDLPTSISKPVINTAAESEGGFGLGLLRIPGRLIQSILTFCIEPFPSPREAVLANYFRAICRTLHNAAEADEVWKVAFLYHWDATVADRAIALGSCWRERYACICKRLIREFRSNPTVALNYCENLGLVDMQSSTDVARFLHVHSHLVDKSALGDYLGDSKRNEILKAWTHQLSELFEGVSLETSLRIYLLNVRLPGEAPKLDRMFELLVEAYCARNIEDSTNPDVYFVLIFSLIMLNTDLHSSRIKNKTSAEQFMKNCSGIDNGSDLPKEYLQELYDSIKQSPLISCI